MVYDFWSKCFRKSPISQKLEVKFTILNECFIPNFTSNYGHIGLFMKYLDQKSNNIVFLCVSNDYVRLI